MIRVLIFLGLVLAAAFGFAWLADRPGTVSIDWMGYQIELSAMITLIGLAVLIVVVMALWWIVKGIIRSPQIMGGYFSARRRDKGYEALSSGLIAAGSGDHKAAERFAVQAKKLIPDAPLTKILQATSADLNKNGDAKRLAYRDMLDSQQTQLLGLRGLYLDAVEDDDEEAARHYAAQAAALAPALPWAGEAQFEEQVQRADWAAARAALERNLQARIVTKTQRDRLRAVLLTAEAIDREEGEPDSARPMALEAHKLARDLVPASAVAGRLLIRAGKMTQASKVIETTWRRTPHPELAEVYLYVRPGDAVADRIKRARKLAQLCAHAIEGELAVARALMEAGLLDTAKAALDAFTGPDATQRVCLLMAEIEEKQGGDTAAVRGWMARALRAKRDPVWVADGFISSTWEPVSPLTGKVDAFEWKVPVERYAGHDPVAIPADAMADDGHVMLPARLPGLAVQPAEMVAEAGASHEMEDASDGDPIADAPLVVDAATEDRETVDQEEPAASDAPTPEVESDSDETLQALADGPAAAANDDGPADEHDAGPVVNKASAIDGDGTDAEPTTGAKDDDTVTPFPLPVDDPEAEHKTAYSGLPHGQAPDDPGPDTDAPAEDKERRRFRLF